ncbi:hypothetical protein PHLGIDRAFT_26358 [Phlebiopsis gigantea 11061_1 CR5-6]|uniref:Uncharacterized protein n=1 Tax=Phlebiopsis gigantea (strain 11061_1 CR5-6) TaxID=745531 RepID=A0A0C3S4F5_PHLG1|nr:hypothetical protein PHLGIDRAFT_26358 [Phlebiopsis gigantea 11061_1 CR5-6]
MTSMKRKLSSDFEEDTACSDPKRANMFAFPTADIDTDVAMSDASSDTDMLTPYSFAEERPFHTRLNSNASTSSTVSEATSLENSPSSSPYYPDFVLYPSIDRAPTNTPNYFDSSSQSSPKPVGLIQPGKNAFTHHGQKCSQIPKLRMACASGLNGSRTMWAHCEQCGAIEMVDFD